MRPIVLAATESVYDLLGATVPTSFTGVAGARAAEQQRAPAAGPAKREDEPAPAGNDVDDTDGPSNSEGSALEEGEDDAGWTATMRSFMQVTDDDIQHFVPVHDLETPVAKEDAKATVVKELEVASSASVVSNRLNFWLQKDAEHQKSPAARRMFGQSESSAEVDQSSTGSSAGEREPKALTKTRSSDSLPTDQSGKAAAPRLEVVKESSGDSPSTPRKSRSESKKARRRSPSASPNPSPKMSRGSSSPKLVALTETTPAKNRSPSKRSRARTIAEGPVRSSSTGSLDSKAIEAAKSSVRKGSRSPRPAEAVKNSASRTELIPAKEIARKLRVTVTQNTLTRARWPQVEQPFPKEQKKLDKLPLKEHDNFTTEFGIAQGSTRSGVLENARQFTKVFSNSIQNFNPRHFIGANENGEPLVLSVAGMPTRMAKSGANPESKIELGPGDHVYDVLFMSCFGENVLELTLSVQGDAEAKADDKPHKQLQKNLRSLLQPISKVKLLEVAHADINPLLVNHEHLIIPRGFKCGVLFCKKGQTEENDMFRNAKASSRLQEFLELLGERTVLKGMDGFTGGLDTRNDSTGTHCYQTTFEEIRCIFHVSTELPMYEADEQQLERKRHLGNDIVVIVFNEDASPFDPATVKSEFNHVFCIVNPLKPAKGSDRRRYRISFAYKLGCNVPAPLLPEPSVFEKSSSFRKYLMTKLINAERAALEAPIFFNKLRHTRSLMLKNLVSELASKSKK